MIVRPRLRPRRSVSLTQRLVIDISVFICAIDLVYGMVAPTFSLFVRHLGGSTFLVGLLAGTVGITRLMASLPAGILSDRWGRKAVLVAGAALFVASCLLFSLPADPRLLVIPRMLFGLAILSTFPLGAAYIADVVPARRQTLAISLYVSAQGLGYSLGPLVGSALATLIGFRHTYQVAAALAGATALYGWLRLRPRYDEDRHLSMPVARRVLLNPVLMSASGANIVIMLMFNGTIIPFLSLYAASIGIGTLTIGILYATRSAASMIVRVPAALLAGRLTNAHVLLLALLVDAAAAFGIAASRSPIPLFLAAAFDGIAFGAFLASSQSIIAEQAAPGIRGAAMGMWATAGALGETAGGFAFGAIGHALGLRIIFVIAGVLLATYIPVAIYLIATLRRSSPTPHSPRARRSR